MHDTIFAAVERNNGLELTRAEFIEWLLACALLVVGASLLLRARAWITALSGVASHPFTPQLVALRGFLRLLLGGAIFSYLVTQG
jgi:hypothetical protein